MSILRISFGQREEYEAIYSALQHLDIRKVKLEAPKGKFARAYLWIGETAQGNKNNEKNATNAQRK